MATALRFRLRTGAVAVVLGALALASLAPIRQAYTQNQRINAEEAKLQALEAENRQLRERLERLNDPDYVEKLAREQLGLVKPGEVSYVVVPPAPSTSTTAAPPAESRSLWQRIGDWWSGLFGKD